MTETLTLLPDSAEWPVQYNKLYDGELVDLEARHARWKWTNELPEDGGCRVDQAEPDEEDLSWFIWLLLAGRGAGKTRSGAEWLWWQAYRYNASRWAIVAPTQGDTRKTCFEGESGLLARIPHALIKDYSRQELVLTLHNGSQIFGYSAEEPNRLRGPQHHGGWCDELAAWRYLDDTLDNLLMGLRLGSFPRIVATTTPRPIKRLKEIIADPATELSRVSTYANRRNLPPIFFDKILKRYEGTRLGRQELHAELIDEIAGALWTRANLEQNRILPDPETQEVKKPDMVEIVVSVDPPATSNPDSDEAGITVCGRGTDGRGYLLADWSMQGSPDEWGRAAVLAYDEFKADRIVAESNQGGEMVSFTIASCAKAMRLEGQRNADFVPITLVNATRGKVIRAEPISALYEQNRVSHIGTFAKLEDQMTEFTRDFDRSESGYSPDRVDSLVWAFTHLMLDHDQSSGIVDYYRQEAEALRAKMEGREVKDGVRHSVTGDKNAKTVRMIAPDGVSTSYGRYGTMYTVGSDRTSMIFKDDVPGLIAVGWKEV